MWDVARSLIGILLAVSMLQGTEAGAAPRESRSEKVRRARASASLERELLRAVREAGFDGVLDFKRNGERIAHPPNVDVAVIELDPEGRPVAAANVLLSRDYPKGVAVPIDVTTWGTTAVRYTRWDLERWDGGKGWSDATAEEDLVPGRAKAKLRFMAPYPASLFKLMIAFRVMRLVDRGEVTLAQPWRFIRDTEDKGERPVWRWMEPMVTESDNGSTEALVKLLHEKGGLAGLNTELAELGLGTLQVNGTSPVTGRSWNPGSIHMTALDTARLLLLIEGGPGVLWRTPTGREVTAAELSPASRVHLQSLLADQALHEALSSTLLCGDPKAERGLPAAVPARWVNPKDGTVTAAETAFGRDTRPCNAAAEVAFLHKTGLTENYGSDGGIVRAMQGEPQRHYVVVFLSNLGYRYYDAAVASAADPAKGEDGFPYVSTKISYTQRIPALGRRIDTLMKERQRGKARPSR
ncbi:serine hydrolase [Pyxidicoccus trucidator]|uniref:serine hydrolase n=1 Tax=Pyxidicoccus trucidator TaxID=2709662 RepID=UPI0019684AB3|nr:serine hydrolase [Pyxidicoccus trucidator]